MFHEGIKAFDQVIVGLIEIIGVPGISNAPVASCKCQKLVDLAVRIAAGKTRHIRYII